MTDNSLAERLLELQGADSGRSFARSAGISPAGYRALLAGASPTLETLLAIAAARGVRLEWLATGDGSKFANQPPMAAVEDRRPAAPPALNPELLGRVLDRVSKVYRDLGRRVSEIDKGRIAAERYNDVSAMADGPEEWPALLDLIEVRLKRALHEAAADLGKGKREA